LLLLIHSAWNIIRTWKKMLQKGLFSQRAKS
jgi:hypothetical protein